MFRTILLGLCAAFGANELSLSTLLEQQVEGGFNQAGDPETSATVAPADAAASRARPFDLMVGDPAPPLAVQEWLVGEPVAAPSAGDVLVVFFWASWSRPCLATLPQLSSLQERYGASGLRVVGVNVWEDPKNAALFLSGDGLAGDGLAGDQLPGAAGSTGSLGFAFAIESKEGAEDLRVGRMAETWMHAAGRRGIPSAFVVDRRGRLAWIGHPSLLEAPLLRILTGDWDLQAQAEIYAQRVVVEERLETCSALLRAGDLDAAYAVGLELLEGAIDCSAMHLNALAWALAEPQFAARRDPEGEHAAAHEADHGKDRLGLALNAAMRANERSGGTNPNVLDTLAFVYLQRNDLAEALRLQRLAVDLAEEANLIAALRARLFELETEARERTGSDGPSSHPSPGLQGWR